MNQIITIDLVRLLGEQPEPTIMTQLDELAEDVKSNYNKVLSVWRNNLVGSMINVGFMLCLQMQYSDIDLGPSGTRCIAEALLAEFPSMEGGPFINLNSLCLWSCNVQDYGAVAIVSMHCMSKHVSKTILFA